MVGLNERINKLSVDADNIEIAKVGLEVRKVRVDLRKCEATKIVKDWLFSQWVDGLDSDIGINSFVPPVTTITPTIPDDNTNQTSEPKPFDTKNMAPDVQNTIKSFFAKVFTPQSEEAQKQNKEVELPPDYKLRLFPNTLEDRKRILSLQSLEIPCILS